MPRYFLLILALSGALLSACAREGCTDPRSSTYDPEAQRDNGTCVLPYALTQAELNAINTRSLANITGVSFGGANTIPHILTDGTLTSPNQTYRDIYTNRPGLTGEFPLGSIIVKRMHDRNTTTGAYGRRRNTYIMVKQYPGYYPEGGDWQYIAIPQTADSATVNPIWPNGRLIAAAFDGKVALCADCHRNAAGGRFVFTP